MRLALCLAAFSVSAFAAQIEGPLPAQLELTVGAQKRLDLPSVDRVSVGNADIADLRTDEETGLVVVAMAEGETTVRVWTRGAKDPAEMKLKVLAGKGAATLLPTDTLLALAPGEQRAVHFPGLTRVIIGDDAIVSVQTIGNDRLLLTAGKETAKTTLLVWMGDQRKSLLVSVGK